MKTKILLLLVLISLGFNGYYTNNVFMTKSTSIVLGKLVLDQNGILKPFGQYYLFDKDDKLILSPDIIVSRHLDINSSFCIEKGIGINLSRARQSLLCAIVKLAYPPCLSSPRTSGNFNVRLK